MPLRFKGVVGDYALLAVIAATLHFAWENAHVSLYGGYGHLVGILPVTVWATAGDVMYTCGAVFVVGLCKGRARWFSDICLQDLLSLSVVGFFIAIFVEYKAFANGSWFYLDAMPIIPFLGIGLSPVLQMVVLLPLSIFLTSVSKKSDSSSS
ncbi:MAG: hypothetical protein AAB421_02020 [Patescibacteria group bacterium]